MTLRAKRDLARVVEAEGLKVVGITQTGGNHLKVVVDFGRSVQRAFIAALTASDQRAITNFRGDVRRAMREEGLLK